MLMGVLPPAPARVADLGCGTGTLSVLLAEEGYAVDGLDVSPEMVSRARAKAAVAGVGVDLRVGDANVPDLDRAAYDVVLSRHVLWAMDDAAAALRHWLTLLAPGACWCWSRAAGRPVPGSPPSEAVALVRATGRDAELRPLPEAVYWGKEITDDRYLLVSRP